jgi:hypothetical protein
LWNNSRHRLLRSLQRSHFDCGRSRRETKRRREEGGEMIMGKGLGLVQQDQRRESDLLERGGERVRSKILRLLLSSPSDCELISSSSPSLNARHSPCSAKRGDHSAQSWNSVLGQSKLDERSPQEIGRLQGLRGWIRGLPRNARCLHPQYSAHGKEKCKPCKWNIVECNCDSLSESYFSWEHLAMR